MAGGDACRVDGGSRRRAKCRQLVQFTRFAFIWFVITWFVRAGGQFRQGECKASQEAGGIRRQGKKADSGNRTATRNGPGAAAPDGADPAGFCGIHGAAADGSATGDATHCGGVCRCG